MTLNAPIITVFGATGFVGRAIVAELVQQLGQGSQAVVGNVAREPLIRVATRHPAKAEFLRQLGRVGQVTPIFCNPADPKSLAAAVAGASIVVNCIGRLTERRRGELERVFAEMPGLIARAVQDHAAPNARFIHVSALGADANGASRYARAKAAGEGVVRAILPTATILKPSIVFGPGDNFFNRFAKMALLSPVLPLIGGGRTKLQPVYVGDVARAVVTAALAPQARGMSFELAGPRVYNFRELMETMLQAIGRKRCLVVLPWGVATMKAAVLQNLPGKLLTVDQVKMLKDDNVASRNAPGLSDMAIMPTALEAILPFYMDRFRPRGRFR